MNTFEKANAQIREVASAVATLQRRRAGKRYTVILQYPTWSTDGNVETRCSEHRADSPESAARMARKQASRAHDGLHPEDFTTLMVIRGAVGKRIEMVIGD